MKEPNQIQLELIPDADALCDSEGKPNARRIRKIVFPKLSAAEFAELLGVSPSTVRSWEYDARQPSGAALALLKLAAANPELVKNVLGARPGTYGNERMGTDYRMAAA